jgi:hypothetical protein
VTSATKILVACLVLGLPLTAAAQSNDVAYCRALSHAYRSTAPKTQTPSVEIPVAIAKCHAGDTSGIATLEKALRDAKVELPSHT